MNRKISLKCKFDASHTKKIIQKLKDLQNQFSFLICKKAKMIVVYIKHIGILLIQKYMIS